MASQDNSHSKAQPLTWAEFYARRLGWHVFPLQTAHAYRELGWAVLPLCSPRHRLPNGRPCQSPGKVPVDLATGWHLEDWQTRGVPTPDEVEAWLRHQAAERLNLGVLTGRVSGVVALDVDGEGGEALLRELAGGEPAPTWEFRTGAGRRPIYALPPGVSIPSSKRGHGHQGLEVLSDGRQMVVPPSIHPTGAIYEWLPGRDPWTFGPPAPAPDWLLRAAGPESSPTLPEEWARIVAAGASPGGRHPTMARLAGRWLAKGLDPREVLEMLLAWNDARCSPPKPEAEVVALVRDLWRKDQAKGAAANG